MTAKIQELTGTHTLHFHYFPRSTFLKKVAYVCVKIPSPYLCDKTHKVSLLLSEMKEVWGDEKKHVGLAPKVLDLPQKEHWDTQVLCKAIAKTLNVFALPAMQSIFIQQISTLEHRTFYYDNLYAMFSVFAGVSFSIALGFF